MSEERQNDVGLARLPTGLVDQLTKPVAHFLRIEAAAWPRLLAPAVVEAMHEDGDTRLGSSRSGQLCSP